jgi:hypothetical protein
MRNRGSKTDYVAWLSESTIEEGPVGDLLHAGKRAAQRGVVGAKSFLGSKSANGEFDVMDVTAKIRGAYLRDCKAIGVPYTMQTLTDFLLNKYGVQIDPASGAVLNDDPRETAQDASGEADAAQSTQAPSSGQKASQAAANAPTASTASTSPEAEPAVQSSGHSTFFNPKGSEKGKLVTVSLSNGDLVGHGELTGETTKKRAGGSEYVRVIFSDGDHTGQTVWTRSDLVSDAPSKQPAEQAQESAQNETRSESQTNNPGRLATNVSSKDGTMALQQAAIMLNTPNPNAQRVMGAIARVIQAVKRDNNPQEKQFVANWLRKMRDQPSIIRKVPQLANLTDDQLSKLAEDFVRLMDCTIYLVEAGVRDTKTLREAVDLFFEGRFGPNSKIDRATLDNVLTGVAKFLNAAGAVEFNDGRDSHLPKIGFVNRGNTDAHIKGTPGNLDSVTAARTGQTTNSSGTTQQTSSDNQEEDGDDEGESQGENISAELNTRVFEHTLEELGMTGKEISDVWEKARAYRHNPKALYDTMHSGETADWAKRIAVAAMVSILVELK